MLKSIIRLVSYLYFYLVHLLFWIYNFLFNTRRAVPRPAPDDLEQLLLISASQAAEMIRKKELSSYQIIEVYIRRIHVINPVLNAVVQENFEQALLEAQRVDEWLETVDVNSDEYKSLAVRKPLLGVPFSLKDSFLIRGMTITAGIPILANSPPCEVDAAVIQSLKEAGGIPLVVTNVPEACLWWQCNNGNYGQTNSPYDSRRGVGGSSGGEGCLIGAAGSVVGIGSDIGGSIRIPAFFNGVFGLKPTSGIIPTDGHIPPTTTKNRANMFTIGPLCRYARDLPLMFKVMIGSEMSDRLQLDRPIAIARTRIFFMKDLDTLTASPVHPDCSRAVKKAVKYFEKKYDISAYNVNFPIAHYALDLWMTRMHADNERFADVLAWKEHSGMSPLWEIIMFLLGLSKHTFVALVAALIDDYQGKSKDQLNFVNSKRDQLRREVVSLLGTDGILIFPGFPRPAYFHNESVLCPFDFAFTALWSVLELPVVACPMGLNSDGLPVGVQIVGGERAEALLIAIAQDLEEGFGGWKAPVFG